MENSKTYDRLKPAINHKYDREKMFAIERDRNRRAYAKTRDSRKTSAARRAANPRHQASMKIMARLGWLLRHEDFSIGKCPPTNGAESLESILGTTAMVFREHLGAQFHSGMSWDNYGPFWHLGHRVPIRLFDCSDPNQARACFHYKNLQPELVEENLRRLNEA